MALLRGAIAKLGENQVGFDNRGIGGTKLIGHEFTEFGYAQALLGVDKRGVERSDKLHWNGVWNLDTLGDGKANGYFTHHLRNWHI